jgi:hypothetical protein
VPHNPHSDTAARSAQAICAGLVFATGMVVITVRAARDPAGQ